MPVAPAKPCCKPGCAALTRSRYCETHTREQEHAYDKQRGSPSSRGYGHKWRMTRARFLRAHPLCVMADEQGKQCLAPATDVDHIVPKRAGGTDEWSNLQPLCHACHSTKTAREDGRWGYRGGRG